MILLWEDYSMAKRHTAEEIVAKLRQFDVVCPENLTPSIVVMQSTVIKAARKSASSKSSGSAGRLRILLFTCRKMSA